MVAGRVAKRLGIDYAAAIIGFEYKRGQPFPKIYGIVVPTECAEVVELAVSVSEAHTKTDGCATGACVCVCV